jgi:hypothetical protein
MPATPDQISAHVSLLRAVDRILIDSEELRQKRENLERLMSGQVDGIQGGKGALRDDQT